MSLRADNIRFRLAPRSIEARAELGVELDAEEKAFANGGGGGGGGGGNDETDEG